MSGSTSDSNRGDRVAEKPTTPRSTAETRGVTTAAEIAANPSGVRVERATTEAPDGTTSEAAASSQLDVVTPEAEAEPNQTAEEAALAAQPRTGPIPGDDPEANPSHPSSLRVRRSDGELVLKNQRGGKGEDIADQLPGFEAAEAPRATPSHPSSLTVNNSGPSAFSLVDAHGEQPESDASAGADVSDERVALATPTERGATTVRYAGSEAVTVIVPEDLGDADGLITEGTVYNFRPGESKTVPSKHAGWLRKHPTLTFEK